jgi:Flp pilus assembly protein TadD
MKISHSILLLAAGVAALSGCAAVEEVLPQRSDLFQLSNDAQLAYDAGEDARAEKLYMALARSAPNDPEIWLRLGNLYARANRPDAAADAYQRSLALKSNDARVWHNLAVVRLRQGWAALIQANAALDSKDPLYRETERMIGHLGQMPAVGAQPVPGAPASRQEPAR